MKTARSLLPNRRMTAACLAATWTAIVTTGCGDPCAGAEVCVGPGDCAATAACASGCCVPLGEAPVVNAGADQIVVAGTRVDLNGNMTRDNKDAINALDFEWIQRSGPSVAIAPARASVTSFIAPGFPSTLTIGLEVMDTDGNTGEDTVTIDVVGVAQPDAGFPPDAGPVAGPDAGATHDSGTASDAGTADSGLPSEWKGPISIFVVPGNQPPTECPTEDSTAFVAFDEARAERSTCDCDCERPAVACPTAATLRQYPAGNLNCLLETPASEILVSTAGCTDLPFFDDVRFSLSIPPVDLAGVQCTAQPTVEIPAPTYNRRFTGCRLEDRSGHQCIYQAGDHACPASQFTERAVIHRMLADDRGCAECTCGAAQGGCTGRFVLRAGESCSVASPGTAEPGRCVAISTPARSGQLEIAPPDVTCPASRPTPTGGITPQDTLTVCCIDEP